MKNKQVAVTQSHTHSEPSELRHYLQKATTPAGRKSLLVEVAQKEKLCAKIEASCTGQDLAVPLRSDLAKNRKWSQLRGEIGSAYCACAVGARGEGRDFQESLVYLSQAVMIPREDDDYLWSLEQNNKGAIHYWHAICLSGWIDRHDLASVSEELLSACISEMRLSVFHLELSLEVRGREDFQIRMPANRHLWAQTAHNLGKSKARLALWEKSVELAGQAVATLKELLSAAKANKKIKKEFPRLEEDLAEAQLIHKKFEEAQKLDKQQTYMAERSMGEGEDESESPQSELRETHRAAAATVSRNDEFWKTRNELVPELTREKLERFVRMIMDAQKNGFPVSEEVFVNEVNAALDANCIRFRIGDGKLGRLFLDQDGIVQFTFTRRKGTGYFTAAKEYELVAVPRDFLSKGLPKDVSIASLPAIAKIVISLPTDTTAEFSL